MNQHPFTNEFRLFGMTNISVGLRKTKNYLIRFPKLISIVIFAGDDPPDCEIESDSMLLNREGKHKHFTFFDEFDLREKSQM